jgi:signal transduction histidine kinase
MAAGTAWTDRLSLIARRAVAWRAPFVYCAFVMALAAYGLAALDLRAESILPTGTAAAPLYGIGLLALAACSAGMIAVGRETTFRYLLAAYTADTAFLLVCWRLPLETEIPLVLMNVIWALLFEPFPSCLALGCAAAAALPTVVLLRDGTGIAAAASVALAGISQAVFGSLLLRAHERNRAHERYVNRLEENVAALTRANILSQEYAKDIEMESRARERDRLTRDIHDAIGYTITNAAMMMEAIKVMARTEPERVPAQVKRIRTHMEEGLAGIKRTLRDFRASEREAESVYMAVKKLVKVFTISTGMRVRWEMGNAEIRDLERFPEAVYHFIQEGLINAFRHGHASRVLIMLWDYGSELRIMLDDDGIGSQSGVTPGIGISGMRERAGLAGGRVAVDASPTGFRISMYLPTGR